MSVRSCDVVVIGAGAIGAACAYFAALTGSRVTVVDRGAIASGTSSAGEGNLLISDKTPGPELQLALYSQRVCTDAGLATAPRSVRLTAPCRR